MKLMNAQIGDDVFHNLCVERKSWFKCRSLKVRRFLRREKLLLRTVRSACPPNVFYTFGIHAERAKRSAQTYRYPTPKSKRSKRSKCSKYKSLIYPLIYP